MSVRAGVATLATIGTAFCVGAFFLQLDSMLIGGSVMLGSALIAASISNRSGV